MFYKKNLLWIARKVFILILIGIFIFPLYWMFLSSIRYQVDVVKYPPEFIPSRATLEGYTRVWLKQGTPSFYLNTVLVNILGALFGLLLGIPAAYAASRYNFKQKDNIMFTILSLRFLPPVTALLPIFILYKFLGIIDTKICLILTYAGFNLPIIIWVLKSFFDEIPREIEEAYMIDGHSKVKTFFNIILPLGLPGIVAMFMLSIFLTWGEFLVAVVLTFSTNSQTLPVGAAQLQGDIGILWQQIAAIGVLAAIPIILIIVFFQRYLVRGFSFGILK